MKYSERVLNILTALTYKGVGRAAVFKWFSGQSPSVAELVELLRKNKEKGGLKTEEFFLRERGKIERELQRMSAVDGVVAFGEEDFPVCYNKDRLKDSEQPVVLFYRGDLSLLSGDKPPVAVIGLLTPSGEIEQAERMVVREFVSQGAIVVSGLANGCDSIAHHETLECGGKTVAILPSTLESIVPKSNADLASRIVAEGGLLITEYYTEPVGREQTSRYIERDRLQALFSSCVVLSASYAENKDKNKDSGSRHAMSRALEYGIDRAVIYNEAKHRGNSMFDLNRQILEGDKAHSVYPLDGVTFRQHISDILAKVRSLRPESRGSWVMQSLGEGFD